MIGAIRPRAQWSTSDRDKSAALRPIHMGMSREQRTELTAAAGFVLVALALALCAPETRAFSAPLALLLGLLYAALHAIEFDVGEGRTRPLQLVFVPMLLLLPPQYVPLLVGFVQVVRLLPRIATRQAGAVKHLTLSLADAWFAIGPAAVLAFAGPGWPAAGALALALFAQLGGDALVATCRLRFGLSVSAWAERQVFAWMYLVDVLLAPIGLLAALAGRQHPLQVALVMPLAGLLVIFARERRGRIENALELGRLAGEEQERLSALLRHASDTIAIVGRDGLVHSVTGAADALLGPDWEAEGPELLTARTHPDDVAVLAALLERSAAGPHGEACEAEWRLRAPDGSWRHVQGIATNLLEDPRLHGLAVTLRDVHERRAFEEQLRHRAFHDELTQLPNRALFDDRVEHALAARSRRQVAVLMIDVDDLKVINDRLGHGGGDAVLTAVAGCLRGAVRQTDTPARLGGDEFAVLLEDVAGPNEPVQVAQRILAACAAPGTAGDQHAVRVSIGIGLGGGDGVGADELLRRADLAMYAAKHAGGGRLQLFEPALEAEVTAGDRRDRPSWLRRSDEQAEEVRSLLARPDGLTIAFQPIMDLRTGAVVAYEALARFTSAVQRAPDAWFAQAHRCGLGYELEARAVATALAVPGLPPGIRVSVNLSPSALASEAVAAVLPADLSGTMIEITEHELVAGNDAVQAAIARVRQAGAWLAVDDAGAGYAGLEHVMRLAPDVIKLDRSIVDGVADDPVKGAMIASFVRYARDIDATVCAEGIETLQDLDRLAALDVALGQGYALARPAPPWAPVERGAAQHCVDALAAALARPTLDDGDHPLDAAAAQLAALATHDGLADVLEMVQRELRCEHIVVHERYAGDDVRHGSGRSTAEDLIHDVLSDGRAHQAVINAGEHGTTALHELGLACMLAVPITCEDRLVGVLELGRVSLRPWSRFELRQARLIAHHLGSTLERVGPSRLAA